MKKINIITHSGDIKSSIQLEKLTFFSDLVHKQAIFDGVNIENQNRRQSTAHTKTKAEVSGTGKKPFRQKHTGNARQGSRRNPHFVGGGCAFGPKNLKNYVIKLNKKVSNLSFLSAWNYVLQTKTVMILENNFYKTKDKPSTKHFFNFLKKQDILTYKILLVNVPEEKTIVLSSRNIPNVQTKLINNLSVRDLLNQNYLLITQSAWALIDEKLNILAKNRPN